MDQVRCVSGPKDSFAGVSILALVKLLRNSVTTQKKVLERIKNLVTQKKKPSFGPKIILTFF